MSRSGLSLRFALLTGASAGVLALTSTPAFAQDLFHKSGPNPSAAAASAAAGRATQNQAAATATARTIQAFQRASQLRQRMDAAQAAARAAAAAAQTNVRNGLGPGGLQVANGAAGDPSLWVGASGPTQTQGADGRTTVDIDQNQERAILTWDSFNIGRETDLVFDQHGNTNWVALNRVTDVSADPSKILGTIKADGTVLILNRNGVIFSGTSQVNARNIVAAAARMSDEQFLNRGLYSQLDSGLYKPTFTDAGGAVTVEAGAQLNTRAPDSVLTGGGYVLLAGTQVTNAGSITTAGGQALLAAGDDFVVRAGFDTDSNKTSTTNGNEVRGLIDADSASGAVTNSGVITATRGDITLTGRTVVQDGVLLSTTSVNQRGTIHLSTSLTDGSGTVKLTGNSLTAILPELDSTDTALNAQRDALAKPVTPDPNALQYDNLSTLTDRRDQSRVEIVAGQSVLFDSDSTTLAQGGQVSVLSAGRTQTEAGSIIDVSGVRGVALDPASNVIKVNIQGNELRDSPANRDEAWLKSQDVWIDMRDLLLLPAGTGGYTSDRYYTGEGLLEVSGYVANTPHTVGEWASAGGTITLAAQEVVAKQGSVFNISGGSLDYAAGSVLSTRVLGADGKLYDINEAPTWMKFYAVGNGLVVNHDRWGEIYTQVYTTPLFSRGVYSREEDAYTVGRDGGQLVISAPTTLFDGEIVAETIAGSQQVQSHPAGDVDGYKVGQSQIPLNGRLSLGRILLDTDISAYTIDVRFDDDAQMPQGLGENDAIAGDRTGTAWFDAGALSEAHLGGIDVNTIGDVAIDAPVTLADGGSFSVVGAGVDIAASITARGGTIDLEAGALGGEASGVTLRSGATLDVRGLWVNALLDPQHQTGRGLLNGGKVTLASSSFVTLEQGSTIDASSGAAILSDGTIAGGRGGDVSLTSGLQIGSVVQDDIRLTLDGDIRGYGVTGGGTLTLRAGQAVTISTAPAFADGVLHAGEGAPTSLVLAADLELEPGEIAPASWTLTASIVVPAGTALPADYATFTQPGIGAGQELTQDYLTYGGSGANSGIVLGADWTLPPGASGFYTLSEPNTPRSAGDVIHQGETLYGGYGRIPGTLPDGSHYIVPADVFPNGLPTGPKTTTTIPAGSTLDHDVTYEAGATMPAGSILNAASTFHAGTVIGPGATFRNDVQVEAPLALTNEMFGKGFSNYVVASQTGIGVTDGTAVAPTTPVYRVTTDGYGLATGADPASGLELWTPPLFLEDPVHGKLTQRAGASLTLQAASPRLDTQSRLNAGLSGKDLAPIAIGRDSSITVDPGQAVTLDGWGEIDVEGAIVAPGGKVSIINTRPVALEATADPKGLSIWLGEDSLIDVAGRAYTAEDRSGRSYGMVLDGGSVVLGRVDTGGNTGGNIGTSFSTDAFVVQRPGSVIDASGASAAIDLSAGANPDLPSNMVMVAGDGGSISASSYTGIYLEGTLLAKAGGAGASGGALTLSLDTPLYQQNQNGNDRTVKTVIPSSLLFNRVMTVVNDTSSPLLPDGTAAGVDAPELVVGEGRIGADQIDAGGFDSLTFQTEGNVRFENGVKLSLGRSISLPGAFSSDDGAVVSLSAPYVLFTGQPQVTGDPQFGIRPSTDRYAPGADTTLTISAGLIDLSGRVGSAFTSTTLSSTGDIRLLVQNYAGSSAPMTTFGAGMELTLRAAQIYPGSGVSGEFLAGVNYEDVAPDSKIIVEGWGGPLPDAPLSAFGKLLLYAGEIEQGGVLRAPFGTVQVGLGTYDGQWQTGSRNGLSTSSVEFLPGSVTSTSGADLMMAYGGTSDGLTYSYNGKQIVLNESAGILDRENGSLANGVGIGGSVIHIDEGATIDLTGGGTLAGAGFVAGRGGSVDLRKATLGESNPFYTVGGGGIYAILPGFDGSHAPVATTQDDGNPAIGQQITVPEGVPGLPAGTYTLLPSSYALLPGAYRVELGSGAPFASGAAPLPDGSSVAAVTLGIAGTGIRDALPSEAVLSPGSVVRTHTQYNEMNYGQFAVSQAGTNGLIRPWMPADAGALMLDFGYSPDADDPFENAGTVLSASAASGLGSEVAVVMNPYSVDQEIDILGAGDTAGPGVLGLRASDLNALNAGTLSIGVAYAFENGRVNVASQSVYNLGITLREGAVLNASQVILATTGNITVESGAGVDATQGKVPTWNADMGYVMSATDRFDNDSAVLLASNGNQFIQQANSGTGSITIDADARLLAGGTLALVAPHGLDLSDDAVIGAKSLNLSLVSINIGTDASLASADADGALPTGWSLTQARLDALIDGDPASGVPGVQQLLLSASDSINFIGTVTIDTTDPVTGKSRTNIELDTPAVYGLGSASDVATLITDKLVWNGILVSGVDTATVPHSLEPGPVLPGGPGTGSGTLNIIADQIEFGYGANVLPQDEVPLDRAMLGFSTVNLTGHTSITANSRGTLAVYQSGTDAASRTGGNLNLLTPLLTAESGAKLSISAGGALVARPADGTVPTDPKAVQTYGGEVDLTGGSVTIDTAVGLPSGRLALTATDGDILLTDRADIDLSGRSIAFFDVTKYSWGGDMVLESANGAVRQQAGSVIDLSAGHEAAGWLQVTATGGAVDFAGTLLGGGADGFKSGTVDIRAGSLADFAGLNAKLDQGGFFETRDFVIKTGDLIVGDEVHAHNVAISIDGGSLTVNGRIDASGEGVGSIRLAARDDLTLGAGAVLDAHGTVLRADSYGNAIEAVNTPHVELGSSQGRVVLDGGATIDMRSADDVARGRLEIDAPRLGDGDIAIDAGGQYAIRGAASIAVNGFRDYTIADGTVDQSVLDGIDGDSTAFIDAALANGGLQDRLAGLSAYGETFHLRPGVTLLSGAADGHLTVTGDLDFSGYRYGPAADPALRGSGEPGKVVLRAAGDLTINGSINDGFAPPPPTPEDRGWVNAPIDQISIAAGEAAPDTVITPGDPGDCTGCVTTEIDYAIPSSDPNAYYYGWTTGEYYGPGQTIPAGTLLGAGGYFVKGTLLPFATTVSLPRARPLWIAAPMLAAGSQSWSMQLVAGADLASADTRTLLAPTLLGGRGNIVLDDQHKLVSFEGPHDLPSVVRTGTGDLDLRAGGDIEMKSIFAVYTAGTQAQDVDPAFEQPLPTQPDGTPFGAGQAEYNAAEAGYQAWYPEHGGDLAITAQHDVLGVVLATSDAQYPSWHEGDAVENWLWTQGGPGEATAWWINFGGYIAPPVSGGVTLPSIISFQGFGTFGGGNLDLTVGGGTGPELLEGIYGNGINALSLAIGSTGRVQDGRLVETGGGDLTVHVGGDLERFAFYDPFQGTRMPLPSRIANLRGDVDIVAGAIGRIGTKAGILADPRATDPFAEGSLDRSAGIVLALGDGDSSLHARGDLYIQAVEDPGLAPFLNKTSVSLPGYLLPAGTPAEQAFRTGQDIVLRAGTLVPVDLTLTGEQKTFLAGQPIYEGTNDYLLPQNYVSLTYDFTVPSNSALIALNGIIYFGGNTVPAGTIMQFILPGYGDIFPFTFTAPVDRTDERFLTGGTVLDHDVTIYAGQQLPAGVSWQVPIEAASGQGTNTASFSLTTARSRLDMFSAGANLSARGANMPTTVSAVAAAGSIYSGEFRLAPSPDGQLEMLAAESINGSNQVVEISGADPASRSTPFRPGYLVYDIGASLLGTSYWSPGIAGVTTITDAYQFGLDTASGTLHRDDPDPARIYAVSGDIVDLRYGAMLDLSVVYPGLPTAYLSGKPVDIRAGRDIVRLGAPNGASPNIVVSPISQNSQGRAGLIVQDNPTDISTIWAGRDLYYTNMYVAGPGTLVVRAGRNLYQGDRGVLDSIGAVPALANGSLNDGANIAIEVGVGAAGPDYADFAGRYLDPANLADPARPLDDAQNAGKVAKVYDQEMLQWLRDRYGYSGGASDALAYFLALPAEQQGIFDRQVYYDELREGGREFNDPDGKRFQSYLRGREAIATLFPDKDASGNPITYAGDIIQFSGSEALDLNGNPQVNPNPFAYSQYDSHISTEFGGDIQLLAPGGAVTIGVDGIVPGASSGLLTQGSGDIEIYARDSILLGLSRVFTTFGGDIVMWSAEGDINAGRGAKGTVVYAPARRVYDMLGDVSLSPIVPSSGAGIGTLAPIPEVPAGDVDLIAPLGTIDAGEAGIRVSGNINLAALHILNAANIQVKGTAAGIPQTVAVNTGALTAASAATGAVANEAAQLAERARPKPVPRMVPTVVFGRFLGFGE